VRQQRPFFGGDLPRRDGRERQWLLRGGGGGGGGGSGDAAATQRAGDVRFFYMRGPRPLFVFTYAARV